MTSITQEHKPRTNQEKNKMMEGINMENLNMGKNESHVYTEFINGRVDKQHYEKGCEIHRFSALKRIASQNINEIEEETTETLAKLHLLSIRPSRVFLWNGFIEIDWTPKPYQCVKNREEYLKLSLEFARFIDSLQDSDIEVNVGSFLDDAYLVPSEGSHEINYNPKFTKECFHWNDEIEVINFISM